MAQPEVRPISSRLASDGDVAKRETRDGSELSIRAVKALLVDDARFDLHASPAYHPERPERLIAARAAVRNTSASVAWKSVDVREASADELARVHDPRFIEVLDRLRGEEGFLDPDTYISKESVEVARLAAGGTLAMVDAILDGGVKVGVALPRPPGHHARANRAMGFCLLNNVAIAAAHARARGLRRVAIIDWDVHHGNGTQEMFYDDPSVLYASLHQFPFYPGTGATHETGEGDGRGYTVNIPLAAHGDDTIYRGAFDRILMPVLDAYAPELVLVSAGFDASARDPLAQMELTARAFRHMAEDLRDIATKHAAGRIALILEGGYDLVALESGLREAIYGALGIVETRELRSHDSHDPELVDEIESNRDHEDIGRAAAAANACWGVVS
jgi:acetoin utilization deacetylase AcuC-like enzyme